MDKYFSSIRVNQSSERRVCYTRTKIIKLNFTLLESSMKTISLLLAIVATCTSNQSNSMQPKPQPTKTGTEAQTDESVYCIRSQWGLDTNTCSLSQSIEHECLNCLRRALDEQPELINQVDNGLTLLHFAAAHGKIEAMSLLLAHGAHINAISSDPKYKDYTALCFSIKFNYPLCVEFLVKSKAALESARIIAQQCKIDLESIIKRYTSIEIPQQRAPLTTQEYNRPINNLPSTAVSAPNLTQTNLDKEWEMVPHPPQKTTVPKTGSWDDEGLD